jgi:hypothetical protein
MSNFTNLVVSIIMLAMVAVLVTRKNVAPLLKSVSDYLAGAIKAVLGN